MIPPGFLQELLARCDIVEVVGAHVTLKKAGINYKGLCPFHGEKTPSFIVSPTRQTYHCFGCGVHGDAIRFLSEHAGLSFLDAVHDLAQRAGLTVPSDDRTPEQRAAAERDKERQASLSELLARAAEHYQRQLKDNPRAVDYLKQRGLTGQVAARYGLGYASAGWRNLASCFPQYDDPALVDAGLVIVQEDEGEQEKRYDRFRDRVMFPIRNVRGEVVGFGGRVLDQSEPKYLNSPETPVFIKGRELYGLFEARQAMRQAGYALVVEGYMDVVALAQLGFEQAVATLGTACTAEHVQKLFRFTDHIVFSFDGDSAGRRAAQRALEAALPHATDTRSVRFLFLPPEHDPDSFVRANGADAFAACVAQAVPLSRQMLDAAAQECDLGTAEGRARMLARAKPWWASLPDGALKAQLLGSFATAGDVAVATLAQLWADAQPMPRARQGATEGPGPDAARTDQGAPPTGPRGRSPAGRAPRAGAGRPIRHAPQRPVDHAVRTLALHCEWWEQLSAEEHALLLALPPPHGDVLAWLDRHLAEHGVQEWATLARLLAAESFGPWLTGLLEGADNLPEGAPPTFEELRTTVDRMVVDDLKTQENQLIARAPEDAQARQAWREVHERRRRLEAALTAAARSTQA